MSVGRVANPLGENQSMTAWRVLVSWFRPVTIEYTETETLQPGIYPRGALRYIRVEETWRRGLYVGKRDLRAKIMEPPAGPSGIG